MKIAKPMAPPRAYLIGDIHQPLHTIQLFSREYPSGDRGNEACVSIAQNRAAFCIGSGMG